MQIFRSLTNRIFLATTLMALLSIGLAVLVVNVAVTRQAEDELLRGLEYAASLVEQDRDLLIEQLTRDAQLVADLPKLKAAVGVDHPPTLQPIAEDYQYRLNSDLFVVTNASGAVLAERGTSRPLEGRLHELPPVQTAMAGRAAVSFWPQTGGGTQVVTVPIWIDETRPELLGTLSVGFDVSHELAIRFKELTESEVAFLVDGEVQATTLPPEQRDALDTLEGIPGRGRVRLRGVDFVAITRTLSIGGEGTTAPVVAILRPRTEQAAFLRSLQAPLVGAGLLAVLLATLLSYAVARTVTRPVGAITETMREMTATGDLTKRISLSDRGPWTDDDALMLAGTFNTLTDSIARFQQEAAQRDRLSALGRLSTVIAHEVRNPLMIIKAALRDLTRPETSAPGRRQAARDIDEEVGRLNRVVSDVLDFARPVTFEAGPVSLNRLCTDAVAAVSTAPDAPLVATHLDPAADRIVTDGERLRLTIVNVLTNARHAVNQPPGATEEDTGDVPPIQLRTERLDDQAVAIVIRDTGPGIAPDDLPKVFDPYFTTKRTGSGLGLAIAKNVVEGLGGRITVDSRPDEGTEMRIRLPRQTPERS